MRASSCQSVSTAVSVGDLATFAGNRGAPKSASNWVEKDLNMGSRSDTDSSVDLCDVLWRTMVPHWGSRNELDDDWVPSGLRMCNGCEGTNNTK